MKVYFAAFEALPFVKTGGLADVVGSLPSYYDKKIEVTTILPFYRFLKEKLMDKV
ncbi:MAG: glycogen/starch synthase, partial [Erysipelotrichaceae bacterium]|nr:glycogen/starch synthase [Erysipelotrichaceae bacterium]